MKNINEINAIIKKLNVTTYNAIWAAEEARRDIDKELSDKGAEQLEKLLNVVGLTVDEWFAWCDD